MLRSSVHGLVETMPLQNTTIYQGFQYIDILQNIYLLYIHYLLLHTTINILNSLFI